MPTEPDPPSPSSLIDARIEELSDWRGETLARVRRLIARADPGVVEEWKWRGVPVWSHDGIICTGETYRDKVKLTFAKGASLEDPAGLFNASLDGNTRRAIDLHEGDTLDQRAFTSLVRAAVGLNTASRRAPRSARATDKTTGTSTGTSTGKAATRSRARANADERRKPPRAAPPPLLSGGNPQIARGEGNAPVQAYLRAMPGWKRDVGRHLDALVGRTVPNVRKAVKWNTPFYGVDGNGWFLSFRCFTKYVKVTFFEGASLRSPPPVASKDGHARSFHVHQGDQLDEELVAGWLRQASEQPGWVTGDISS
jgi:hypothetical protein